MCIGQQIRQIRVTQNKSREEVADWLNISLNTYKKIESGDRSPSFEEIKVFSEKMGIEPTDLIKGSSNVISNSGANSPGVGIYNTITNDKEMMVMLVDAIKQLTEAIGKK